MASKSVFIRDQDESSLVEINCESSILGEDSASVVFHVQMGKRKCEIVFWRDELEAALEVLSDDE
jgi:hypothetical protein